MSNNNNSINIPRKIRVYPFSFGECYFYVGGDERKGLDQYMLYGGMPRILQMTDDQDKKDYFSNLYSELYVKDIAERTVLRVKIF